MSKNKFKQQLKINQLSGRYSPPSTNEILQGLGLNSKSYKVVNKTCDNIKIMNLSNNKTFDLYY